MKINNRLVISIGVALMLTTFLFKYLSPRKVAEGTFKLHNNMYACGDCPTEYEIISIASADIDAADFLRKYVRIDFTPSMQRVIYDKTVTCTICFNYIVTGSLYKTMEGYLRIEPEKLELEETFKGCCSE